MIPKIKKPKTRNGSPFAKAYTPKRRPQGLIGALELGRFLFACPFSSGGLCGETMIGLQPDVECQEI
jgi:hypothetical protein